MRITSGLPTMGIGRRDDKTRMDPKQKTSAKEKSTCTRYGKDANPTKCPAVGTICEYCKNHDHWLSVCRKRDRAADRMNTLEQESLSDEDTIIDILSSTTNEAYTHTYKSDKWLTTMYVCDTPLKFRIDTGANCNVMVKSQHMNTGIHDNEQDSQMTLRSFKTIPSVRNSLLTFHSPAKWVIRLLLPKFEYRISRCFTGKHHNWSYS